VIDAELDWREWTDQQGAKREAVTFRARQVLFGGARPRDAADAGDVAEGNGSAAPTESAVAVSAGRQAGERSAGADDLPF
jgi:single-stranded DNA-binding protein